MEARFLNIDLELVTDVEPSMLLAELGDAVVVLDSGSRGGGYLTTLETAGEALSPEAAMREFRRILDRLPEPAEQEWSEVRKKEFNFGFEVERASKTIELSLSPEVIAMIAETHASFKITVYNKAAHTA